MARSTEAKNADAPHGESEGDSGACAQNDERNENGGDGKFVHDVCVSNTPTPLV
jgi:hypothetical protein